MRQTQETTRMIKQIWGWTKYNPEMKYNNKNLKHTGILPPDSHLWQINALQEQLVRLDEIQNIFV